MRVAGDMFASLEVARGPRDRRGGRSMGVFPENVIVFVVMSCLLLCVGCVTGFIVFVVVFGRLNMLWNIGLSCLLLCLGVLQGIIGNLSQRGW